jgi:hypothetical protein
VRRGTKIQYFLISKPSRNDPFGGTSVHPIDIDGKIPEYPEIRFFKGNKNYESSCSFPLSALFSNHKAKIAQRDDIISRSAQGGIVGSEMIPLSPPHLS